jgi:hypothetical protein
MSPLLPLSAPRTLWVLRLIFATILIAITFIALILSARRLSGALHQPLDFGPAFSIALLLACCTWLLRLVAIRLAANERQRQALLATITAITGTTAVALTLSNMSPLAVLALWLPVIAAEIAWRVLPGTSEPEASATGVQEQVRQEHQQRQEVELSANVVQQLVRVRDDNGERVSGVVRVDFAPEEQTTVLHLAFSPPLAREPRLELAAIEASGVTVRATDCRTYGVRLEAKRGRETQQELSVLIKLVAMCQS